MRWSGFVRWISIRWPLCGYGYPSGVWQSHRGSAFQGRALEREWRRVARVLECVAVTLFGLLGRGGAGFEVFPGLFDLFLQLVSR